MMAEKTKALSFADYSYSHGERGRQENLDHAKMPTAAPDSKRKIGFYRPILKVKRRERGEGEVDVYVCVGEGRSSDGPHSVKVDLRD